MLPSVDSISLVHSYRHRPPDDEMTERGWVKKKGVNNSTKWICNGLKGTHEPRLSFYETWERIFRLRVDLSIPNLIFGANVQLPNETEIREALELISNNIGERAGVGFDAFSANVCRLDYSMNLQFNPKLVKSVIGRYRNFAVPRLTRHAIDEETVYFSNKSRTLKVYDKHAQVCAEKLNIDIQTQSEGIVRAEYGLTNADSIKSFANRLGFRDTTAKEMLSQENIRTALNELGELLKFNSINFSPDEKIRIAYEATQNMRTAMRLSSFIESVNCFGESFYLIEGYNYSKSTYDRNMRECQDLGLI